MRKIAHFGKILDETFDIILITNATTLGIQYANQAAIKAYGYTYNELLAQSIATLRAPHTAHNVRQQLLQADQEGVLFETVHMRKDGSFFPVEVSAKGMTINKQRVVLSIIRDMTERKQADEKIRQLTRAVEQSPTSVVVTDIQGNIEYVNPKFTQVTGYAFAEVCGKNPRILKSGEQPPAVYKELWDNICNGGEWRGEFHNRRKNGELYWEMASISPIRDEKGKITHFIAVKEDITERKRIQEELQRTEERLRRELELAGKIQRDFLPPPMNGDTIAIDTIYHPHHHVSGDLYEYSWDENKQLLQGYMIDIMGHGLATALQNSALRVLFHQADELKLPVAEKLHWINKTAVPYFAEDSFAAVICFEADFKAQSFTYASGGINRFLLQDGQHLRTVRAPGLFLGMMPDTTYEQYTVPFRPGSHLHILSDGIYDLLPPSLPALEFAETVQLLKRMAQSEACTDDASAICVHFLPPKTG